jgi:hypothetical protein
LNKGQIDNLVAHGNLYPMRRLRTRRIAKKSALKKSKTTGA